MQRRRIIRIGIYGRSSESKEQLKKEIEKAGFRYNKKNPDIIISYGGDGTFLRAERAHPGVPKALFRYSKICKKCHNHPIQHALELIKKKKYALRKYTKITAKAKGRTLTGTNDIVVRNALPTNAIRFTITKNGKKINEEFIGDGIVAATSFGSTGYYHSITRQTFKTGIKIALNNTTKKHKPIALKPGDNITIKIIRGPAQLAADNNPNILKLKTGDKATIQQSKEIMQAVKFSN